jgi:predicted AlkP superfamily pyrophosphatase or phosphodiesterase
LSLQIWVTAEKHDLRSAIHMWPGSEAHIGGIEPTYLDRFNGKEHLDNKVRQVIKWLDLPGTENPAASKDTPRPQLIAFYVPDVDSDGHNFGPNSTYIRSTIAEVDGMLGKLFSALSVRNLTEIVNVVIVSDHGMATTSSSRLIQFEDLIDPSLIAHTDGWPLYGLRPIDPSPSHLQELYESLLAKSLLPENLGHFSVYLRDTNMPEHYHFSNNPRIAPLWIVPAVGWAIVTRSEFDLPAQDATKQIYHPRGLHGYDHTHPLMRAIFAARGPAFGHLPAGTQLEPFQNIQVYNLVCDSLGIPPVQNNGTLRLPLGEKHAASAQPVDIYLDGQDESGEDDIAAALEVPHSHSSSSSTSGEANGDAVDDFAGQILPPNFPVLDGDKDGLSIPEEHLSLPVPDEGSKNANDGTASSSEMGENKSFWEWMKEKVKGIIGWG